MTTITSELQISVVRYSFFNTPKGTLRYAEHSPATFCEEKQICNCTRSVAERPAGKPSAVQQYIEIRQDLGDYRFELRLGHGAPWFTFRWRGPEEGWTYKAEPERAHAYFTSDVNHARNLLHAEITVPGYGLVDHFFGDVFFGNKVDTSTLMNGHSPSKVIDLAKIPENQVWTHACNWGKEAITPFKECEETNRWRAIKKEVDAMAVKAAEYNRDLASTVDGIRLQVMDDEALLGRVLLARDWFASILRNLKKTEMWRACDEVNAMTEKKGRR